MNRLTRTKLEKLLYIHDCRVDQIVEGACSKLDDVLFDLTVTPAEKSIWVSLADEEPNPHIKMTMQELALANLQGRPGRYATLGLLQQQANYSTSRMIEDGLFAPHGQNYSDMNTLRAPVRFYNPL